MFCTHSQQQRFETLGSLGSFFPKGNEEKGVRHLGGTFTLFGDLCCCCEVRSLLLLLRRFTFRTKSTTAAVCVQFSLCAFRLQETPRRQILLLFEPGACSSVRHTLLIKWISSLRDFSTLKYRGFSTFKKAGSQFYP